MNKTLCRTLAIFLCVTLGAYSSVSTGLASDSTTNVSQELDNAIQNKIDRGMMYLQNVKSQIKNSQEELQFLQTNKTQLKSKIRETKVNVRSLRSQILNLNHLINSNQQKVNAVRLLIAKYENQIEVLKDEVKQAQTVIDAQAESLNQSMSAYYLHTNAFFSDSDPKLLALLAYGDTTGDVLRENEYLFTLQSATQDLATQVMASQKVLDEKQEVLNSKVYSLNRLKDLLASEERDIRAAEESQKRLLTETRGKQLIYETLLELSEKEEVQVALQVEKLKENFTFFQSKLDALKTDPVAKDFDFNTLSLSDPESSILRGNAILAWPVSPALGISAYFHDESYKAAMGVAHQAVDIRIAQGSQVRAPADGVVSKVADNDMAYSYIIIAHPGNILTLYGHMSDMFVTEGEVVRQGQVIGLSGGMPGSKGAGWLTTGPHLHFEVFKDWKHVDPLDYLPLELVPVTSLPEKYLNKITGEKDNSKVERPNDN